MTHLTNLPLIETQPFHKRTHQSIWSLQKESLPHSQIGESQLQPSIRETLLFKGYFLSKYSRKQGAFQAFEQPIHLWKSLHPRRVYINDPWKTQPRPKRVNRSCQRIPTISQCKWRSSLVLPPQDNENINSLKSPHFFLHYSESRLYLNSLPRKKEPP